MAYQLNDSQRRKLKGSGTYDEFMAAWEIAKRKEYDLLIDLGTPESEIRGDIRRNMNGRALDKTLKQPEFKAILERKAGEVDKVEQIIKNQETGELPDDIALTEEQMIWLFHNLTRDNVRAFPSKGVEGQYKFYRKDGNEMALARFYERFEMHVMAKAQRKSQEIAVVEDGERLLLYIDKLLAMGIKAEKKSNMSSDFIRLRDEADSARRVANESARNLRRIAEMVDRGASPMEIRDFALRAVA